MPLDLSFNKAEWEHSFHIFHMRKHIQDTIQAAELCADFLFVASPQQVTEYFWGERKNLAGRIRFIHVQTDCLCSSCMQYGSTVSICESDPGDKIDTKKKPKKQQTPDNEINANLTVQHRECTLKGQDYHTLGVINWNRQLTRWVGEGLKRPQELWLEGWLVLQSSHGEEQCSGKVTELQ